MAHGIYRGIYRPDIHGDKHNQLKYGANMTGVTKDATSQIYVPANLTEWTTTMLAAGINRGNPSLLWLCQEASGNLADSIGSFTGTASGATINYNSSVTGWTRKGVTLVNGGTGMISNTDAGLPDVSTTSALLLAYINFPGSASGNRNYVQVTPALATRASAGTTASRFFTSSHGNTATGAASPFSAVRPVVLRVNVTSANQTAFTDADKISPTFGTITGKGTILGGDGVIADVPGSQVTMYVVEFFGAAAEMTDAEVKSLLRVLGWTIAWT